MVTRDKFNLGLMNLNLKIEDLITFFLIGPQECSNMILPLYLYQLWVVFNEDTIWQLPQLHKIQFGERPQISTWLTGWYSQSVALSELNLF